MPLVPTLERLGRLLPPPAARLAKRWSVGTRYASQKRRCREGFRAFGDRYPHPVLFIAGLPKSGTTWLERMITGYEGFHDLLIPEVAHHEFAHGGSHDFELPGDMFDRFADMLVLTKMHVHGSAHNAEVLRRAGAPYVVLHRDLRDVAVSYCFYVRRTPWHPEHPRYQDRSLEEGLRTFAERRLKPYADWVQSWRTRCDPELGLEIRYEQMLDDTLGVMTQVTGHLGLDDSPETVARIVEANSFKTLSRGREQGRGDADSFFRKGVAGDWRNHFNPEITALFKERIGGFLIEHGYETGLDW